MALPGVEAAQALERDGLATDAADRYNAAAGLAKDDRNAAHGATNTVGISASYGSQSSKSETRSESSRSQGSTLTAGQNMAITATGKKGGAQSGDITVGGSALKAGGDLTLDAARDISLLSAQNTERTDGKNSSKGGNIGVGIGVGSGGYGISVSAGVNAGKGHENGNGLTHSETTLDAGNRVSLTSGRDTTLKGAQVSGEQITADVGRNLTLQSEQDSDRYDASQKDISAGGSLTFGSMTGSGYVSATQDKLHSNFDSVKEQTGLYAGSGGFDIRVGEHTQLDGAVIANTAEKGKNSLDTGTLGWSDIDNRADFSAKHSGGSLSCGGPVGKDLLTNIVPKNPNSSSAITDSEAGGYSYYDKFKNADGGWNWPKNLGFEGDPVKTTIPVGTRLDRYGEPNGSFLAPKGTHYEQRALAPGAKAEKYYEYEVIRPLPAIQGKIAPAFGESGGGVQILPNLQDRVNVEWLLKNKYIREVR